MTKVTHDSESSRPFDYSSRRQFLALAATGTLAGVGTTTAANAQSQSKTIRLGGKILGWVGREPEEIQGVINPTLELKAGTTYRITWENLDGAPHNIALLDAERNVLQRTQYVSEVGATQTIEFTATPAMAEYVCQAHLASMRGDIRILGDAGTESGTGDAATDRFIPKGTTVRTETLVDGGLTAPLGFEMPLGEHDRFFIVDQVGQIYTYEPDGGDKDLFLDIADQLINFDNLPEIKTIDERGLLGLAFHPNFQENRRFYVHYSAPPRPGTPTDTHTHTQVLSEFKANEDLSEALPETERTVLEIPSPYYTHNGGAIVFGPEGYLYMGMGDGGGSLQAPERAEDWYKANLAGNGQDVTENLLGSILRIDVDSRENGKPYGIPDGNPLVGKKGLDEYFAWGFRNPWRIGFSNGQLFAGDVGQNRYEEINRVRKGGNYGWNVREGGHCFVATKGPDPLRENCPTHTPPSVRGGEPLIDPIIEYPHTYHGHGVGVAVIGGYLYENATIPALQGKYVFGDYSKNGRPGGSLFAAAPVQGDSWMGTLEELVIGNEDGGELDSYVLCIGRDNRGELYVLTTDNLGVTGNTGAIHRIIPKNIESTPVPPTKTPERPPTATPTPEPTPTPTTTSTQTLTETSSSLTEGPDDMTDEADTTDTVSSGESGGIVSGVGGPGFGVLVGLAGLAGVAVRLLSKREKN